MSEATRERLFGWQHAFDHPVVLWASVAAVAALALAALAAWALRATGRISRDDYRGWMTRWRAWLWLLPLMLGPVLLGAAWVMAAVCLLSLLCYREFARVTGLFREKAVSLVVVLGILLVTFAALDRFDRLFFASAALTVAVLAVVTLPQDRPRGYVQRVALGIFGFFLCGYSLGYLAYFANSRDYRPVLVLILVGVEVNALTAFALARALGGPKLLPNTSPGKTLIGSLTALVLATALVAFLGHFVFAGTAVDRFDRLAVLGLLVSVPGLLGGLVLSSIKRDAQVKETGAVVPGHGGLLDRFESLLLVPPAVFHYLALHLGPPAGEAQRILTGG
jgi:phosphatidate cytidylyltransferase